MHFIHRFISHQGHSNSSSYGAGNMTHGDDFSRKLTPLHFKANTEKSNIYFSLCAPLKLVDGVRNLNRIEHNLNMYLMICPSSSGVAGLSPKTMWQTCSRPKTQNSERVISMHRWCLLQLWMSVHTPGRAGSRTHWPGRSSRSRFGSPPESGDPANEGSNNTKVSTWHRLNTYQWRVQTIKF